jgi:hypothetical protein
MSAQTGSKQPLDIMNPTSRIGPTSRDGIGRNHLPTSTGDNALIVVPYHSRRSGCDERSSGRHPQLEYQGVCPKTTLSADSNLNTSSNTIAQGASVAALPFCAILQSVTRFNLLYIIAARRSSARRPADWRLCRAASLGRLTFRAAGSTAYLANAGAL